MLIEKDGQKKNENFEKVRRRVKEWEINKIVDDAVIASNPSNLQDIDQSKEYLIEGQSMISDDRSQFLSMMDENIRVSHRSKESKKTINNTNKRKLSF